MNRTERLYGIVEELRAAGPAGRTSTRLADRFGVSTRTIKRDITALMAAEVPIWASDGRRGGYRLARQAALPPVAFTSGEATAIAIALAAEPELPFGTDGRSALTKVLRSMADGQRQQTRDLAARVWMRTSAPTADPRCRHVLDEGLRNTVVINVDYRDRNGVVTRGRSLEPLGFARTNGYWWLLAWCRDRDAGRWFRMDRILAAHLTRQRFPARNVDVVFGTPPDDARPVELDA